MATEESQKPAAEFEVAVTGLLANFAPSTSDATNSNGSSAYPDDVFDKVSRYLVQAGKLPWSLRPRTYIVLRLINRLDSMPAFILDGLFDIAFPYTYNRLPASLSPGTRNAFLEQQSVVLSKAGDLEMEQGRHRHFPGTAESNFVVVKQLGSGYFGVVDHVRSKLSLEEYARKRTVRARTFSKDKKALKVFENELSNLKRLSHRHLVKYVGSYTDPHYIGLLMSPVADCDLRAFLTQPNFPSNLNSCLRSFFGCLASAVSYLHSQKCRHKDLKPGNILVKGDVILITDFGTSRNWSDKSKGTTTGESGPYTPGYAAPEVVAWEARNESSDIWSLACVFLDILSVLKGETLKAKDTFFGETGNGGKNPRVNPQALHLWLARLSTASDEDNQPVVWIQQMLEPGPKDRISSVYLLDAILVHADQHIYYGHCCADYEDDATSCDSSEICDDDSVILAADESTNATSVASDVEAKKIQTPNVQLPGLQLPSTQQDSSGGHLGISQTPYTVSTTPLSDESTSQSATTDTIRSASLQSAESLVSVAATARNGVDSSTSPRFENLTLHSSNPFRPGYSPSPSHRRPVPNAQSTETLSRTLSPTNPFWASLDNISTTTSDRSGARDSFIARAWPTHDETAHATAPVKTPGEPQPYYQQYLRHDTGGAGVSGNIPAVVSRRPTPQMLFAERDKPESRYENAPTGTQPQHADVRDAAQAFTTFRSPSNPVVGTDGHQSHSNSPDFADIVLPLCDSAARGDIPALMKYSDSGRNLKEAELGKLAFRAAAENNQRTIMQLLLDLGSPIYSQDIAEYIVPMANSRELVVDHRKPVHYSVAEEMENIKTRQQGEELEALRKGESHVNGTTGKYNEDIYRHVQEIAVSDNGRDRQTGPLDFLRTNSQFQQLRQVVQKQPELLDPILQQIGSGNPQLAQMITDNQADFLRLLAEEVDEDLLPPGAQAIILAEGGFQAPPTGTIELKRNDLYRVPNRSAIGPWDPAGFHWDLKITPDPRAMHDAIRRGYYYEVINCINQGYNINLRDETDESPLDAAISSGFVFLVELLISYGADPKAQDAQGRDAYGKAQFRFFGAELQQVFNALERHKNRAVQVEQQRFPPSSQTPWSQFLARERLEDERGYAVADPYPQEVFEVPNTYVDRPFQPAKGFLSSNRPSKPGLMRKLFGWELW